jgi:Flp pilus assembly protein TadD
MDPFAVPDRNATMEAQAKIIQAQDGPTLRLARAARQAGDFTSAVNLYRSAVETTSPDPALLVELGDTLVQSGAPDDGIDIYWRVLGLQKVDPKSGARLGAVRGLARAYLTLGELATALEHWNEAHAMAPQDPGALVGQGVVLDMLGRHAEAQTAYRTVLTNAPHDVPARNNLALSLALTGHFPEALEIITPMARSSTATPQIRQNLALIYGLKGDPERASAMSRVDLDQQAVEANLKFFEAVRSGATD